MESSLHDLDTRFYTGEVKKFFIALCGPLRKVVMPKRSFGKKRMVDRFVGYMTGNAKSVPKRRFRSKQSLAIVDIFGAMLELAESYERLLDYEIYIRHYAFSGTRISKRRYLEFLIYSYMGEAYSFKERLNRFEPISKFDFC